MEEPYYCAISLYDTNQREKISETFHFHLNKGELANLFSDNESISNVIASKCSMSFKSSNMQFVSLVICIDKLLSSDIEKDFVRYQKKKVK